MENHDRLEEARLERVCGDCGVDVQVGQGIGVSAPEEEWIDRSAPRPVTLTPLCLTCISKRLQAQGGVIACSTGTG
jgi:hypothetical protein